MTSEGSSKSKPYMTINGKVIKAKKYKKAKGKSKKGK